MSPLQIVQSAATSLLSADLSWSELLLQRLDGNGAEIQEFANGPEAYIRQMGFSLPAEFHVHFIDSDGSVIPSEVTQGSAWTGTRMEVRFSNGRVSAALCVYCPDNHGSCFV